MTTFTTPRKRTTNPCTCVLKTAWAHQSDCLSLYPKQRATGDEPDPLTRLTRLVRASHGVALTTFDGWEEFERKALDLISEVRAGITELASANDADRLLAKDAAALSAAIARRQPIPEADMRSSGGSVIAAALAQLEAQVESLKSGQQRASEARQAAFVEMAHDLLEMPESAREMYLQRIVDNAQ